MAHPDRAVCNCLFRVLCTRSDKLGLVEVGDSRKYHPQTVYVVRKWIVGLHFCRQGWEMGGRWALPLDRCSPGAESRGPSVRPVGSKGEGPQLVDPD